MYLGILFHTAMHFFQFNMSPTSGSMAGYPYGSSSGYAGAMYAAAASSSTSTTKDSSGVPSFSSSLMAAGDSINSLRLKAKQHSTQSKIEIFISTPIHSYVPTTLLPSIDRLLYTILSTLDLLSTKFTLKQR